MMFDKILVPLDGSPLAETVLPHVVALARIYDAHLHLLRVLDPQGDPNLLGSSDPLEWQIIKAEANNYLKSITERLQEIDLHPEFHVVEGSAAESVLEFSTDRDINLIVLSSHGQSGISGWNVSSVVQKIILRARTSIMIVRAYHPSQGEIYDLHYRRILAPLDGSHRAEAVLPIVDKLACGQEAELIVYHVVRKPEMPRRIHLSQEDIELVEKVTERNRIEAARYLEQVKSRVDAKTETRLVVDEKVIAPLHEQIEQEQVDLVVLSAHGYSGGTKWPYGSTVISFIAFGTTPLLIYQDLGKDEMEGTLVEAIARDAGSR
ncbi:MAG: universal stress protein [Anaerolineales bacterium]